MENITTLHFVQITDMNTHYIWTTMNYLIGLGEKYDTPISYHSTHESSDIYYDIYIDCPSGLIAELVTFYVLANLPELVKK